jgi:ADP-ribose pyrophosphatase
VCPSRYEHFGLIPLIALSHGVPVIASREGGFPDVVTNGKTGFLFRAGWRGLLTQFRKFLQREPFRVSARIAEQTLSQFNWGTFVSTITTILYEPTEPFRGVLATVRRVPTEVNGNVIPFEYYMFAGSVHVIPITAHGEVVLISETRHDEAGATRIKIVSGMLSDNEDPHEAAHRELAEEAGIRAQRMEKLVEIPESGAIRDIRHYYCAYDLSFGESAPEDSETVGSLHRFDIHDLYKRCLRGEMGAGKSVIALTALYGKLTTGENVFYKKRRSQ